MSEIVVAADKFRFEVSDADLLSCLLYPDPWHFQIIISFASRVVERMKTLRSRISSMESIILFFFFSDSCSL